VFLADGITGCPDWQKAAADALRDLSGLVVLNPRRSVPPRSSDAVEQIDWEFRGLLRADLVLFWFPASRSVQPIALYELGARAAGGTPLAVGADAGYPRRADVVLQLSHARPGLVVADTLAVTVAAARGVLRTLAQCGLTRASGLNPPHGRARSGTIDG
jgi:hypothetical protein